MNEKRISKKFENLTIPNSISFGGLSFALIGIYLLFKNQITLAIIFLTLTDVFDIADGYVARKYKMFSPIGGDLDSLIDVMAFVVPPFIIALLFDNNFLLIASVFMVGCGIYRLARFNVTKKVPGHRVGLTASLPPHFIYTGVLLGVGAIYLGIFYVIFGMLMASPKLRRDKYPRFITILIMTINIILAITILV